MYNKTKTSVLKKIKYIFSLSIISTFFLTSFASAGVFSSNLTDDMNTQHNETRDAAEYEDATVGEVVATAITAFLSVLGLIFMLLILYSGYLWMTAGGNAEQVTKARDGIIRSIIGLVIIVSSYAIMHFVFKYVLI